MERQAGQSRSRADSSYTTVEQLVAGKVSELVGMSGQPLVIAGNGPSLKKVDYTRVPDDAVVLRINNFYFEEKYYFGKKVHILYVAGHPTVIRDYVNTLMTVQIRREYEVETYIGRTENLFHINKDYFPVVDVRKVFLSNKRISDYMTLKHMPPGVLPTSGVLALFAGICLGFRDIYIAGIDLYTGSEPYAFKVGPNHARLVGIDPGRNGYVHDYHRYDVDLEGLTLARDIPGVTLRSVCPGTFLAEHLSLAPVVRQSASPPLPKPKGFVRDFIPVAVPSSSGGKMSFEQRLQTYDPVRRTIVGYGERFLPARIANPIYRSLKKAGLL